MKWQFESYGVKVGLEGPDTPESIAIMLTVVSKTLEIADTCMQIKVKKDLLEDAKMLRAPTVPEIVKEHKR